MALSLVLGNDLGVENDAYCQFLGSLIDVFWVDRPLENILLLVDDVIQDGLPP